jgi:DNA-binding transcriptional LysR family regulator
MIVNRFGALVFPEAAMLILFNDHETLNAKIIIALVTGGIGFVVAVVNLYFGQRNQRSLERFKTELNKEAERTKTQFQKEIEVVKAQWADRNSAEAAKRDYQYEARKRLYQQIEPLLFQLYEALEEAHYRVRSLARSSRRGDISGNQNSWLATEGYYLKSTVYKIILPAVIFRLLQRRMTFVDIDVDQVVGLRYRLLKLYSRSFTDDFVFALLAPKLLYDPDNDNWRNLAMQEPAVYLRQGLFLGDLENIADALLIREDGGDIRPMLFSEFQGTLDNSATTDSMKKLTQLFRMFTPERKPVLRRMLITQACLAQLILSTYESADRKALQGQLNQLLDSADLKVQLSWMSTQDASADLQVARSYLSERLNWIDSRYLLLNIHS